MGIEEFGHKIAVDLTQGALIIDYENLSIQNGTTEIHNPKLVIYICDETNRLFDFLHEDKTEPDADGNYFVNFRPLLWRPISFIRWTNGQPCHVIGAQTTLPENYGGKNVKKMVSLFMDGSLGID